MNRIDFSSRADLVEKMDRLDSSQDRLRRTLTRFQIVNRIFSRYQSVLTRSVLRDMAKDGSHSYGPADLGAGGCDIARWLIRRCKERGLSSGAERGRAYILWSQAGRQTIGVIHTWTERSRHHIKKNSKW